MLLYFYRGLKARMSPSAAEAYTLRLHHEIAAKAEEIRRGLGKPLIMIEVETASSPDQFDMEMARIKARQAYTAHRIPCFDTGREAFSVLGRVRDYYKRKRLRSQMESGH